MEAQNDLINDIRTLQGSYVNLENDTISSLIFP